MMFSGPHMDLYPLKKAVLEIKPWVLGLSYAPCLAVQTHSHGPLSAPPFPATGLIHVSIAAGGQQSFTNWAGGITQVFLLVHF